MTSTPPSTSTHSHLEVQGLGKRFGVVDALSDVDLKIQRGEFVCLLGPSGCGKTTLLRIIAGFESADRGRLLLDGSPIGHLPPHQRDFGMVFQSLALFPHMTVAEKISYGMRIRGMDAKHCRDRVEELLHVVSLPTIADRRVSELSGGQRQRVAIARALAIPPKLFLLDEPLSALDAQLRDSMQIELRQLQQKFGVTTVLVTHDQTEAMMLADRLVVMRQGRVLQNDVPTEVYRKPKNAFVAEFIGAANMLLGTVGAAKDIVVMNGTVPMHASGTVGQKVTLALRPEDLSFQARGSARSADMAQHAAFPGEIEFVRNLGPVSEIIVRCGEARLRCIGSDNAFRQASVGQPIDLLVDSQRICVFAESTTSPT
ncbi:ABC transporter ATP-binding protein [Rhodoferax sp.]|uniref:ABC transporter ATP-binding protein n=1 Tax=Rhodoferax sp. TaxID=50421 RepID=UPI0025FFA244|nr:ABC transporter ATP-binding protein [Rhodoferax sp.]